MIWKVTYIHWYSVVKETMFVYANTEDDAWKTADAQFGYEEVDIKSVEKTTIDDVLSTCVVGYISEAR